MYIIFKSATDFVNNELFERSLLSIFIIIIWNIVFKISNHFFLFLYMRNKKNYSKTDFLNFWGDNGYIETWDGHKYNWSKEIKDLILNQLGNKKDKNVLEIGCGAGYWTKFLCEN